MGVANWHFAYWPSIDKFSNCSWIGRTDPNRGGKIYVPEIKPCSRDDKRFAAKQPFQDKAEGSEKCNPGVKVKSTAASLWGVGGQRGRGGHCHTVISGRTVVVVKARSLQWCNKPQQSQCSLKCNEIITYGDERRWVGEEAKHWSSTGRGLSWGWCSSRSPGACMPKSFGQVLFSRVIPLSSPPAHFLLIAQLHFTDCGKCFIPYWRSYAHRDGSLWKMHPDSCLGLPPLTCRAHQS